MFLADAHCDSIMKVAKRLQPLVNPYNFSKKHPQLQLVALYCENQTDDPITCYQRAVRYVGHFFMALEQEKDKIRQVKTYEQIISALESGSHGAMLAIEGGSCLLDDPAVLKAFYDIGVRVVGLAWRTNTLAKSSRLAENERDTGLTDTGRKIVEEGNRLGMIFDVSHLSDQSFWDLATLSAKPIVATHSNFRSLCPHPRNLTDDMAKEIIRQKGMIGLNLCTAFVHEDPQKQTVEQYFKHLEHGLSLGGEDCMGFGGDIDGVGGHYPTPLDESSSILDRLVEFMLSHNYSEQLVRKIAGENFLEFFKRNL
jgi:membrane dipeptidase